MTTARQTEGADTMERLGTVTEAADTLGVDGAAVWELVADGRLFAERDGDEPWTIYRPTRALGDGDDRA